MAWHTIQETQKLTGKSRRTLYRDMAAGRLSWSQDGENARSLETSELIRVYGSLLPMAQPDSEKTAHDVTAHGTQDTELILAELKALREEVAELRQAMRLLEYKPATVPSVTPETSENVPDALDPKPLPWWKRAFFSR